MRKLWLWGSNLAPLLLFLLCLTIKALGGRRWIARCPPALWSFWMVSSDSDDKLGGKRLPASASGPLAAGQALSSQLGLPPDVSYTSVSKPLPTSAENVHTKTSQAKRTSRFLSKRNLFLPFLDSILCLSYLCLDSRGVSENIIQAMSLEDWGDLEDAGSWGFETNRSAIYPFIIL